jgi:hypothetical protein
MRLTLYKHIQQEADKSRLFLESDTLTLFVWFLSDNTLDSFQWVMDNRFMINFHIDSGVTDYRSVLNFKVESGFSACQIDYKSGGIAPQRLLDKAAQTRIKEAVDMTVSEDFPVLLEKIRLAVSGNTVSHWRLSADEEKLLVSLKSTV